MAGHAIFFTPTTLNACRRLPHFVLHVFSNLILENIPHEEVFRGCTIIGIFFDSCIAKRDKQIDMKSCLSVASSLNDYDNITTGLGDRTFSRIIFEISPCATLSRDDREGDRGILRLDQAFELGDDDSTPMELYEALVLQLVQHTRHIQTTVVQLLCQTFHQDEESLGTSRIAAVSY